MREIFRYVVSVVRVKRNKSLAVNLGLIRLRNHYSVVVTLKSLGTVAGRALVSERNGKLKNTVGHVNYRFSKRRVKLDFYELRIAKLKSELIALLVFAVKMLVYLIAVCLKLDVAVFTYKL